MRALCLLGLVATLAAAAEPPLKVLTSWTFAEPGNFHGWSANNYLKDARVADGALTATAIDWDPFFVGPTFEIPAGPLQTVELDVKCDKAGHGDLFWSNTLESPYAGFFPDRVTGFELAGDNQWHTVRIRPYWQAERKIVHLRLDVAQGQTVSIRSIRIVEPDQPAPTAATQWNPASWQTDADGRRFAPPLNTPLDRLTYAAVRLKVDPAAGDGAQGKLLWAVERTNGLTETNFPLRADGRWHTYNLAPSEAAWQGNLVALGLRTSVAQAGLVELGPVALGADPIGPPDLDAVYFGPAEGVNRVGHPVRLICRLRNLGGEPAKGLAAKLTLPPGVTAKTDPLPSIVEYDAPVTLGFTLNAAAPLDGTVALSLSGPGTQATPLRCALHIDRSPAAPQGAVPEPKPAKTKYQIGTYYFPGWARPASWEPIDTTAPWRKPVLGWYDEANPEIADWQIKWAVEHGVSYFLVDWYWDRGQKHLDHWIEGAYAKSRFKSKLKWAMMWANHNAAGSHSEADWRTVTQYWLDHYLKTPEYLTIDGKPAVFIWSPGGIRRDMGGSAGAAKLYALSQEMAKAAGLPGITFVDMNIAGGPEPVAPLKAEGFWGETHYHGWYDAPSRAADSRNYPFSLITERSPVGWDQRSKALAAEGLHYLPVADTGWDSRPWHGESASMITGRTAPEFEKLLREAKAWLDARGQTQLVLGPWNEWGEGSWLEPNTEHGFGLLDAVRRVFCDEPAPAVNLAPVDVGLGPYDFPSIHAPLRTSWTFEKAGDSLGWGPMMGLRDFAVRDGVMRAVTSDSDPAFNGIVAGAKAARFRTVVITMSASPVAEPGGVQLFWATAGSGMSEGASVTVPIVADGAMHDYVLKVAENSHWRGTIRSLRLDVGSKAGMEVKIKAIRLTE